MPCSNSRAAGAPTLAVEGLTLSLGERAAAQVVVAEATFSLQRGACLALVGICGAGKTLMTYALLGVLPSVVRAAGSVRLDGQELLGAAPSVWRAVRGRRIALVAQEPATALNPALTIGEQMSEGPRYQLGLSASAARARATTLLGEVGFVDGGRRLHAYPFELSGGERQRVAVAMALGCDPEVLVVDEPTAALDTLTQAHLITLLRRLTRERQLALLFVTHDVSLLPYIADAVVLLDEGRLTPAVDTTAFLAAPAHARARELVAIAAARPRGFA